MALVGYLTTFGPKVRAYVRYEFEQAYGQCDEPTMAKLDQLAQDGGIEFPTMEVGVMEKVYGWLTGKKERLLAAAEEEAVSAGR